mgnify:CR=1 FL=1
MIKLDNPRELFVQYPSIKRGRENVVKTHQYLFKSAPHHRQLSIIVNNVTGKITQPAKLRKRYFA